MSIEMKNIEVRRTKKADLYIYEARLKVSNDNRLTARQFTSMSKKEMIEMDDHVFHNLRMSIISHIYGDLIEPINELATLAGHFVDGQSVQELADLRVKIGDILIGKAAPKEKESPIITN